ncbi:MAG TPA: 1,4-alpha-glucan branching enzyme [Lachnospiraceae bacterium]|nr:1,4-alpha-glucan branching enzyme [Lachnospiraceae bacterium]
MGMHEVVIGDKRCVVVRQLIPDAHSINVIDQKSGKKFSLKKVHDDGFFESIIPRRVKYFAYTLEVDFGDGNIWETADQYTFEPTVTEYDRYLFGAGNHYRIYEKLGAHPKQINGTDGVSFAVWAPNAKSISVVGDFNNWDGRRNMMRLLGESGIWELFIPGIKEFDVYKYQVKAQDGGIVNKADPYGNFAEVRPATASIVYDIEGYKWKDSKWIKQRETTDRYNVAMNIYEVHLGSWIRVPEEGNRFITYKEAADKLVKYVKEMGYTHVEFLPLMEFPFDGSWGYQTTGYYAPTSRFGTPKELMELIDTFHQNNIGVIMDWVPAHFPRDAHGLARFDGTALYEHADPRRGEHLEWGTYIYNYGRNEVKNFLIANAIFWINEYHIDGLRVDAVSSMLYLDFCRDDGEWLPNEYGGRENLEAVEFIKHMNSVISGSYNGVMMIAEESTSWEGVTRSANDNGLGFSLKWNMGWMNDFLSYIKKDTVHRKYHHNYITFSIMYNYSENYVLVLSHDEVVHMKGAMINKVPGDMWQKVANLKVAYGFMYGHPGKKLLFMGDEIGQFSEWNEANSLDWHLLEFDDYKNLHNYVKDLNHFYTSQPALWEMDFDPQGFEWIECDDKERSIVSFTRRGKKREQQLAVVCNFTPTPYESYLMGVPEEVDYEEVFNSDDVKYGGTGRVNSETIINRHMACNRCQNSIEITVPPLGFAVFKPIFKKND